MVQHNMITNRPNYKGDSCFVNSEVELTDKKQKNCKPDIQNESIQNLQRLSNIEREGRSPSSSFNCLRPDDSNQIAVNK